MRFGGQSVGCRRKKKMLVAAAPHGSMEGAPISMLRSAISLLVLFAIAVPAMARKLEATLTLRKSRLRPVSFNGGEWGLWPMTTNCYIDR